MSDDTHRSVRYMKKALPERFWRPILNRQRDRMYDRFARLFPPDPHRRIVDVGVNGSYERPELHFLESRYPYPEKIVACGLEAPERFAKAFPRIRYVQVERGKPLPFGDNEFDLVFCNAVIEHVGNRDRQRAFMNELLRIGRSAFVTTPNRWYPVELHTMIPLVHYLPTEMYRTFYRRVGLDFFSREENLNLLDRSGLLDLIPASSVATVKTQRFLGFVSNFYLVVRARAGGDGRGGSGG